MELLGNCLEVEHGMSVEQQVRDALADFTDLIADGWEPRAAIDGAASCNCIKPKVLEQRLTRIGDLDGVVDELRRRSDAGRLRAAISAEVKVAYLKPHPKSILRAPFDLDEVVGKVEHRIGRPISNAEAQKVRQAYRDFSLSEINWLIERSAPTDAALDGLGTRA